MKKWENNRKFVTVVFYHQLFLIVLPSNVSLCQRHSHDVVTLALWFLRSIDDAKSLEDKRQTSPNEPQTSPNNLNISCISYWCSILMDVWCFWCFSLAPVPLPFLSKWMGYPKSRKAPPSSCLKICFKFWAIFFRVKNSAKSMEKLHLAFGSVAVIQT